MFFFGAYPADITKRNTTRVEFSKIDYRFGICVEFHCDTVMESFRKARRDQPLFLFGRQNTTRARFRKSDLIFKTVVEFPMSMPRISICYSPRGKARHFWSLTCKTPWALAHKLKTFIQIWVVQCPLKANPELAMKKILFFVKVWDCHLHRTPRRRRQKWNFPKSISNSWSAFSVASTSTDLFFLKPIRPRCWKRTRHVSNFRKLISDSESPLNFVAILSQRALGKLGTKPNSFEVIWILQSRREKSKSKLHVWLSAEFAELAEED
jgi:hypothetical protein